MHNPDFATFDKLQGCLKEIEKSMETVNRILEKGILIQQDIKEAETIVTNETQKILAAQATLTSLLDNEELAIKDLRQQINYKIREHQILNQAAREKNEKSPLLSKEKNWKDDEPKEIKTTRIFLENQIYKNEKFYIEKDHINELQKRLQQLASNIRSLDQLMTQENAKNVKKPKNSTNADNLINTMNGKHSIEVLPDEILTYIFSFLDMENQLKIKPVSKKFLKLIDTMVANNKQIVIHSKELGAIAIIMDPQKKAGDEILFEVISQVQQKADDIAQRERNQMSYFQKYRAAAIYGLISVATIIILSIEQSRYQSRETPQESYYFSGASIAISIFFLVTVACCCVRSSDRCYAISAQNKAAVENGKKLIGALSLTDNRSAMFYKTPPITPKDTVNESDPRATTDTVININNVDLQAPSNN